MVVDADDREGSRRNRIRWGWLGACACFDQQVSAGRGAVPDDGVVASRHRAARAPRPSVPDRGTSRLP